MKRCGFVWWRGLLALIFVALIAAILFPVFVRDGPMPSPRSTCQSNLRQISLGMAQYTQDYDEHYPPIILSDVARADTFYGWADALQPYVKSTQVLNCPLVDAVRLANPTQRGYTDYWYNRNFSGQDARKIDTPSLTLLFGDGNDGHDETTARYSLSQLPETWRNDTKSPAYRHLEGANYAFADGHIKWYKPENVTNAPISSGAFTFAVR